MQESGIFLLLLRGCLGKPLTTELLKKFTQIVVWSPTLWSTGVLSRPLAVSYLFLLNLSRQHDVIDVMDQRNILWDVWKLQITLDSVMTQGRGVNRALRQNRKRIFLLGSLASDRNGLVLVLPFACSAQPHAERGSGAWPQVHESSTLKVWTLEGAISLHSLHS